MAYTDYEDWDHIAIITSVYYDNVKELRYTILIPTGKVTITDSDYLTDPGKLTKLSVDLPVWLVREFPNEPIWVTIVKANCPIKDTMVAKNEIGDICRVSAQ